MSILSVRWRKRRDWIAILPLQICGFGILKKYAKRQSSVLMKAKNGSAVSRSTESLPANIPGIPAFIAIMGIVFFLTFNVVGAGLQSLLELGIGKLTEVTAQAMETFHVNEVLQSLVIDGIFHGVGSVLSFLPIIVTLFFLLSMLEDSGYMARVAFIMDKLLRKMGLSGRSIVPLLIGFDVRYQC